MASYTLAPGVMMTYFGYVSSPNRKQLQEYLREDMYMR